MPRHGRLIPGMVIAIAAVALAVPSIAPAASVAKIKASKHREGPYSGGTITDHMSLLETQSYYFRVVNPKHREQHLTLSTNVPASPYYERAWFKGSHDITSEVEAQSGYEFTVRDRAKTFRVEVTKTSNGGSQCVDGHLNKNSSQIDVSLVAIDDETACR